MDKLEFKKYITAVLKPYGFRRTGNHWGVVNNGLLTVLTIYKSSWANGYHVECGAKLTQEKFNKYPHAGGLDITDHFLFPADPDYKADVYKDATHFLPKRERHEGWIVKFYIDLDIFSDEKIDEAFRYNMNLRLMPMLNLDTLQKKISEDMYFVEYAYYPENLHLYGVPEETIQKYNMHCRK